MTPHPSPMFRRRIPLVVGLLFLLTACRFRQPIHALPTPGQGNSSILDIIYLDDPGAEADFNALDIYLPAGVADLPVLVYIHGGGWAAGDKSNTGDKPQAFNAAGFIFVSINYRLSPQVMHPVHVEDVAAAMAWVYANISSYGGDPENIFLLGHSAGAHLAALVATDERRLQAQGLALSVIKGVALLDGAGYDIPERIQSPYRGVEEMYEQAFGTDPAGWEDASPLYHVAPGKHIPPFLLITAGDRQESRTQAEGLAAALEGAGIQAELFHAPDKNHGTVNSDLAAGDYVFEKILEFFADAIE